MKYLNTYKIFEVKKYSSYDSRYKYYTGNDAQPGFSDFIYDFFKGMNDRFKNFDNYYKQNMALKDVSGKTIDTGLGYLIGTAGDLATSVAMKIFEPQDKKPFNKLPEDPDKVDNSWWARKKESNPKDKEWLAKKTESPLDGSSLSVPKTDADVTPEHMRLLNNNFIKKDLANINTDQQMQDWVMDFYKKAGTPPGKNKVADEVASNALGSFFSKKKGINPTAIEGAISGAAPEVVAGAETALGAEAVAGTAAAAEGGLPGGLGVGEIMLALAPIGL